MARTTATTAHQMVNANAIVSGYPFTLACWFNVGSIAADIGLLTIDVSGSGDNLFRLAAMGSVGGDPVAFRARTTANSDANSTSGFSANTWHHACGVGASATSRTVYLDGGNSATNTTSRSPSGMNQTRSMNAVSGTNPSRTVAEAAIWDIDLSADEVLAISRGYSPLLIRPSSLVAYWPLIGFSSPEIDIVGKYEFTLTGTSSADHPRIIYPVGPRARRYTTAAVGGGGNRRRRFIMTAGHL